jgi:hypothetical protein
VRAFCRSNFATFIVAFFRGFFMRDKNIRHELKVYQQGLSNALSRGRGMWLDTDLRKAWYNNSLSQALYAHINLKSLSNVFVHQPSLW